MKFRTMFKGLNLGLGLILLLSLLLVACGDSPTNTSVASPTTAASTSPGTATTAAAATTAAGAGVANSGPATDLNLWMLPLGTQAGPPPADWEGFKAIKEQLNINLNLTLLPVGTEGETKVNAAAAGNNLPDLFQPPTQNNDLFLRWIDQGLIAPVESLLPMMPNRTKLFYSDPNVNKLVTVNGKQYALQAPAQLTTRNGLFVRKDWLDKLGLKAPTTLDEFFEVAKAFTEKDPDGNGKNDTYGFGALINGITDVGWLWTNFEFIFGAYGLPGIWNYQNPANFGLNVRNPDYQKGVAFIKKLNDSKVIDPDWPTLKNDDFDARWKQGKYGMFVYDFAGTFGKSNYAVFDNNFPNGELIPIPPLKGPDGKSSLSSYTNTGNRLLVSKKAIDAGKGPMIAKFLEWIASTDGGYYLLSFGKEGVNFKKDAQGNISTEGVSAPWTDASVTKFLQMRNIVSNGNPAELKARYPSYTTKAGRNIDPFQIYTTLKSYPNNDRTGDLLIKASPNQVDINRYVSENLVQFILAQKPLNDGTWADFIKGLNGLGVADWEAAARKNLQDSGYLK